MIFTPGSSQLADRVLDEIALDLRRPVGPQRDLGLGHRLTGVKGMTTAVASATSGVKSLRIEILPKLPGARGLPPSSPTPVSEPSGAAARVNTPCRAAGAGGGSALARQERLDSPDGMIILLRLMLE